MDNYIETVKWSPSGKFYALFGNREIIVVSVRTGDVKRDYNGNSIIKSICWLDNDDLLLAQQNGLILYIKLDDEQVNCIIIIFNNVPKSKILFL